MKLIEQLTYEMLFDLFKRCIAEEPFITHPEKRRMFLEVENAPTFEAKIKLLNTYKFMQEPIRKALEKIGYVYGG